MYIHYCIAIMTDGKPKIYTLYFLCALYYNLSISTHVLCQLIPYGEAWLIRQLM